MREKAGGSSFELAWCARGGRSCSITILGPPHIAGLYTLHSTLSSAHRFALHGLVLSREIDGYHREWVWIGGK